MSLFQQGNFTLHSGRRSTFKIDCDALTPRDWAAIAAIVGPKVAFKCVVGVPDGGLAFAKALEQYSKADAVSTLIVDDVLTTGASMEEMRQRVGGSVIGVVMFARGEHASWIFPVFSMEGFWKETL